MLNDACDSIRGQIGVGRIADYIPPLADIDKTKFGAAIATVDGRFANYGDAQEAFSIQSISKVFTLALALEQTGDRLWKRVGREPSGNRFNSIVQLEQEHGIPRNPLINAGALVVTDELLQDHSTQDTILRIANLLRDLSADQAIGVDPEVATAEAATGYRNVSLANFLCSFDNLLHPVASVLDVYFQQCAIAMSCEQLARSALFLANNGVNPTNQMHVVKPRRARRICSIMLMCGHYDASGDFAFRVGLPGKSGVGGGIIAIVPDQAAICVWSPLLNKNGNSHAGTAALEAIVQATGWNIF